MKRLVFVIVLAVSVIAASASYVLSASLDRQDLIRSSTDDPGSHPGLATSTPDRQDSLWIGWDFNGGPEDAGGFRGSDRHTIRDDVDSLYWHATTFGAILPGNMCMWCGGFNDRSGSWLVNDGGYGNFWQQIMQLEIGPYPVVHGCSLRFVTRYVIECDYDYAFLEYYSFRHDLWYPVDEFTGKSGCVQIAPPCLQDWNDYPAQSVCAAAPYGTPVRYPADWKGQATAPRDFPAYPYGGGGSGNDFVIIPGDSISDTAESTLIRLRWRLESDLAISSQDGDTLVCGFWLDSVVVKTDQGTVFMDDFDALAEGSIPGDPWSFPHLEEIYDGWQIRYDLNPPFEYSPLLSQGDDDSLPQCLVQDASWQWSIVGNGRTIPASDNERGLPGYLVYLETPAVPIWGPSMYVQWDEWFCMPSVTCDFIDNRVQVHYVSGIGPWTGIGVWGPWVNIDGQIIYGGCWPDTLKTKVQDLSQWASQTGVDSIKFAWVSLDTGEPGQSCWDPFPPPHDDTQYVVDNVRMGCAGACDTTSVGGESGELALFHLGWAVPNPSNPSAAISYEIPAGAGVSDVLLRIYDPLGRHVATLVDVPQGAGSYTATWDGTDQHGYQVASGVYFYRLTWNGESETRRMVLVR